LQESVAQVRVEVLPMTDVTFDALPSQPAPSKTLRPKRELAARPSGDQASSHMLRLFRSNLEVRLRTIDATSLQSNVRRKSTPT
jgi:hypothetical protein